MLSNYRVSGDKGIILTVAMIFIIVLVIVAGTSIVLMTNQTRVSESQIRRMKAFYTAESGLVNAFEGLRRNTSPWSMTITLNNFTAMATIGSAGSGPNNTRKVTSSVTYD